MALLALAFVTRSLEDYSRASMILFYVLGLPAVVLTRYALVSTVILGSKVGLVTAQRVFLIGTSDDIGAFVRYENVDTQFRMPAGYVPLPAFDRDVWVVGGTYWPEPDIAIKVDYVHQRNRSAAIAAPSSFNVGLGWWF